MEDEVEVGNGKTVDRGSFWKIGKGNPLQKRYHLQWLIHYK